MRDELEDAVEFHVVLEAGLNLDGAERTVTVVTAFPDWGDEFEFLLWGKFEKGFCDGELLVDLDLGEADVGNVEEA